MGANSPPAETVEQPKAKAVASPQGDKTTTEAAKTDDSFATARALAYAPGADAKPDGERATATAQAHLPAYEGVPPPGSLDKATKRAGADAPDKPAPSSGPADAALSPEGQALLSTAEKKINVPGYPNAGQEFDRFKENIAKFEKEAKESGLSPKEMQETYKGIDRLLKSTGSDGQGATPEGMRSERQRLRVAEQLMDMVARPEDRSQGSFDTCAMASVEGLLLTGKDREPSKVTNMVADVALTGHTNVNGVDVKLDRQSLQSFGEHAENRAPGEDKQRLAENIFRVTAANVYYGIMRQEGDAQGQLQYVSRKDGNYLKYVPDKSGGLEHSKELAKLNLPDNRQTNPGEASSMTGESRILSQITGKDFKERIVVNSDAKGEDSRYVTKVDSEKALEEHLQKLNKEGKLPAALAVFAGHEVFSQTNNPFDDLEHTKTQGDQKQFFSKLFNDAHSLIITGAQGNGPFSEFSIKNTWGASSNIDISGRTLFETTSPVSPNRLVDNLQEWHEAHPERGSKEQHNRYTTGIAAAALYVIGGYASLATDANPQTKGDYESAGHRVKEMIDKLPKADHVDLAKELAKMREQGKTDPNMKKAYELWMQLIR